MAVSAQAEVSKLIEVNAPLRVENGKTEVLKPMKQVRVSAPVNKGIVNMNARRAAISSIDELAGDFVVCNSEMDIEQVGEGDDATYKLVDAEVKYAGNAVSIVPTGANTIAISGLSTDWTEEVAPITATVDLEKATFTIAAGQVLATDDTYGDIIMTNITSEGDITGTIVEGGFLVFNDVWGDQITYEGTKYTWSNYYHFSTIAPVNGVMEYEAKKTNNGEYEQVTQNVFIYQDAETKDVRVYNFSHFNLGAIFTLSSNKTFVLSSDNAVDYGGSKAGLYYVVAVSATGSLKPDVPGKGTETTLISDTDWSLYSYAGYWRFQQGAFTITRIDGVDFEYPAAEVGDLITPPAGLVTKDYPLSVATWYDENGAQGAYEATVKIGVVDSDVYFQGIDKDLPEAWVKGVLNATKDTIVVPVTYTGAFNDAAHFIGAYSKTGPSELNLVYDADADTYEYGATVMCYKGSKSSSFNYYMNGMFIGVKPAPTAVPDGLETVEMPFKGKYRSDEDDEAYELEGTVNVGWDGNDLYIQNLFSIVEDGWIKGTRNGNKIVFAKNQYIGNLSNSLSCYLTGYDSEAKAVSDVVFTYNENDNYFVADMPVIATRFKSSTKYEAFFAKGLVIGTDPAAGISTVKAEKAGSGIIYNLAGQRVGKEYKGLVIKNGRKLVNK
jgi:hypothetical protein